MSLADEKRLGGAGGTYVEVSDSSKEIRGREIKIQIHVSVVGDSSPG